MNQYLKIFKDHTDYDDSQKLVLSYCIQDVYIYNDNTYNYGSEDSDPIEDEDYDLDAGYYE